MSEPVLQFDSVRKEYRSLWKRTRVTALDGFSLAVRRGEIFGFLGPNGAGKTTAIHLAMGFMRPTSGGGTMLGAPFGSAATRARVGFLAESVAFHHRSAASLVRLYGALNGMHDPVLTRRIREVFELLELQEVGHRNAGKFSRGMLQRVGIAQALVNDPELLILDEPASALDPVARAAFRELLVQLQHAGKTIFLSSHLLSEVEAVCDRVGVLVKGKLVRLGHMEHLLESSDHCTIVARGKVPTGFEATSTQNGTFTLDAAMLHQREIIERIWAGGGEIVSVNPMRRSLEKVFLELAAGGEES